MSPSRLIYALAQASVLLAASRSAIDVCAEVFVIASGPVGSEIRILGLCCMRFLQTAECEVSAKYPSIHVSPGRPPTHRVLYRRLLFVSKIHVKHRPFSLVLQFHEAQPWLVLHEAFAS